MATSIHLKNNSSSNYPFLELKNIHDESNSGEIRFLKQTTTADSGDDLGIIKFKGYSNGNTTLSDFCLIIGEAKTTTSSSEEGQLLFKVKSGGNELDLLTINPTGVGIGTTNPSTQLELYSMEPYITLKSEDTSNVDGARKSKIVFEDYNGTNLGELQISHDGTSADTKGDMIFSTNDGSNISEAIRINSSQNVGIGQIAPTFKLDVSGTARITSNTQINGNLVVDTNTLYIDSTNNCVGIRTNANSSYPFLVSGSSRFIDTGIDGNSFVTYLTSDTEGGLNSSIGGVFRLTWDKEASSNTSYPNSNYKVKVNMRQNGGTGVITVGFFENTPQTSQINFTGQHRCLANRNLDISNKGKIVISTGNYINIDNSIQSNITESIPIVELCSQNNDKKVFGIISSEEDTNYNRSYGIGFLKTIKQKSNNNEQRLHINSIGEGGIWVCNKNGILENGDYITSTTISGYGGKQTTNEGILTNYTVAKITCDCIFSLTKIVKQKLKVIETTQDEVTTRNIDYDINGNYKYEDDLDENNIQQMVYPLETRFLDSNGNELIDESDYTSRLGNSEFVYIACFVGCTYHCG
jgi:hypothetical protein